MYTTVERRKINHERLQETVQRAQREFFPRLQRARGFVGFHLVNDEENDMGVALSGRGVAMSHTSYELWGQALLGVEGLRSL